MRLIISEMDGCFMDLSIEWLLDTGSDGSMTQKSSYRSCPIRIIFVLYQNNCIPVDRCCLEGQGNLHGLTSHM